jgi:hypothetical protein
MEDEPRHLASTGTTMKLLLADVSQAIVRFQCCASQTMCVSYKLPSQCLGTMSRRNAPERMEGRVVNLQLLMSSALHTGLTNIGQVDG